MVLHFILTGLKIALKAKDRLGTYLAFGITAVIFCQLLINLCVVCGLIPPTGIPLPFISAGGSSLVVFLSAIGVLLNISKHSCAGNEVEQNLLNQTLFKRIKLKKIK